MSDPEWLYEPYVVFRKDISMVCDERFRGYGYDRAACISEMYLRDMDFYVLPDAYMMHVDHPRKPLTSELVSALLISTLVSWLSRLDVNRNPRISFSGVHTETTSVLGE